MDKRAILLVLVLTAFPACGGGADPVPTPSEQAGIDNGGETLQPTGEVVGRLVEVLESAARIGDQRAASGDPLLQGASISTDTRGRALFSVLDVLEECQMQTDSRLRVAPSERTPLELEQGTIICRSKPGEEQFEVEAGEAIVGFLDPLFLVEVVGPRTEVRVEFGFVDVRRPGSPSGRLVGPASQLEVTQGAIPARAAPFRAAALEPADGQALSRLRAGLPPDRRGFPPSGGSQRLREIGSSRSIRAGFDDRASQATEEFSQELFGVVGRRWGAGTDVEPLDHEEASQALLRGRLDAFVSPEPVGGAARLALFGDERERPWFLWTRPDDGFQAALEAVLKTILDNGEYAGAYLASFERMPTYEAVRSLVYPVGIPAGRTQWRPPTALGESPPAGAEVGEVTLSATSPKPGPCPLEVVFRAEVEVERPGRLEYEFLADNGEVVRRRSAEFDDAGRFDLPVETLRLNASRSGWWLLLVPDQEFQSEQAGYEVTCMEDPEVE